MKEPKEFKKLLISNKKPQISKQNQMKSGLEEQWKRWRSGIDRRKEKTSKIELLINLDIIK